MGEDRKLKNELQQFSKKAYDNFFYRRRQSSMVNKILMQAAIPTGVSLSFSKPSGIIFFY